MHVLGVTVDNVYVLLVNVIKVINPNSGIVIAVRPRKKFKDVMQVNLNQD
jgi:DNA-binding cell septation regulator SpoVG